MMRTKFLIFVFSIPFISFSQTSKLKKKLIYQCDFHSEQQLKDWKMEGPGLATIEKNQLLIHSKYQKITQDYLDQHNECFGGTQVSFYPPVEKAMRKDIGKKTLKAYTNKEGNFMGGHIVFWNKIKTPPNFIIEFDFQSLSPHSLHMLMFSATGNHGEEVFSHTLKPRNGVAAQYTKGDLKNYRISFYTPLRKTCNMRKCPGRHLICKGPDYTVNHPFKKYHFTLIKNGSRITWLIDGKISFEYTDTDTPLEGGQTALRLMVPAKAYYDNFKIFEIIH